MILKTQATLVRSPMITYEVNLSVDPSIYQEYKSWLPLHIKAILELPGFVSAETFNVEADASAHHDNIQITVLYRLKDRASLDRYLKEDAPRMRKAATDLFGVKFSATRRVMTLAEKFASPAKSFAARM